MVRQALFLLLDKYADWEGAYLAFFLAQTGEWKLKTLSIQREVKSMGGYTTKVDYLIGEIPDDLDLLVLVGGDSWESFEDERVYQLVKHRFDNELTIAAICGAVDYLASSGLLNKHKHTANEFTSIQKFDQYQNADNFIAQQVVRDRNLVTANATAPLDFAELVMELIGSDNDRIRQGIEIHKLGYYRFLEKYGDSQG